MDGIDPIAELGRWIEEAREAGVAKPASVAFVTVGADSAPSARTVTLKRLEEDALVFTSALWTRKAREIEANPRVALLFHWPEMERQVHVTGEAVVAERALAEELFDQRDLLNHLQTVVSRQGEPIDDLAPLRDRLNHLSQVQETSPTCPEDWGALRVHPEAIELLHEAPTASTNAASSPAPAPPGPPSSSPPDKQSRVDPTMVWERRDRSRIYRLAATPEARRSGRVPLERAAS